MEHEQTLPEQRKEGETAPEPDTLDLDPVADADADADAGVAPAADAAPRRRRGRTTLLIAGAAVLGVLAGTVTGYAVQYHREPTPLAPLAQQKLVTPKALAPDDATTNKTINANRWHKTDDDLSKLLIEAPGGAKVAGAGYESLDFYSAAFEEPDRAFRFLANGNVRRLASTAWVVDDRVFVDVHLVQFNDFKEADDYQKGQAAYMPGKKYAGNDGVTIPGVPSGLGHVWVDSELDEEPGYYPVRQGRAIARRGDIVMEIFYVENRGKVSESDVIDLAKRQLERL
ncbi:hypothetical protein [Streptomyces sp. ISL-94]|uniref:hypothetical protein n=1 Tax=Streptomyces sp. ISL-94 TaxID=2819190 RepID=UPI002034A7D3|nr:hypothetical protein [Streptomyces sp. ISL-94]